MAHYRGTVIGNRSETSRLGSKSSGLIVRANGWNIGGEIELNEIDGIDYVTFRLTSGSNNHKGVSNGMTKTRFEQDFK